MITRLLFAFTLSWPLLAHAAKASRTPTGTPWARVAAIVASISEGQPSEKAMGDDGILGYLGRDKRAFQKIIIYSPSNVGDSTLAIFPWMLAARMRFPKAVIHLHTPVPQFVREYDHRLIVHGLARGDFDHEFVNALYETEKSESLWLHPVVNKVLAEQAEKFNAMIEANSLMMLDLDGFKSSIVNSYYPAKIEQLKTVQMLANLEVFLQRLTSMLQVPAGAVRVDYRPMQQPPSLRLANPRGITPEIRFFPEMLPSGAREPDTPPVTHYQWNKVGVQMQFGARIRDAEPDILFPAAEFDLFRQFLVDSFDDPNSDIVILNVNASGRDKQRALAELQGQFFRGLIDSILSRSPWINILVTPPEMPTHIEPGDKPNLERQHQQIRDIVAEAQAKVRNVAFLPEGDRSMWITALSYRKTQLVISQASGFQDIATYVRGRRASDVMSFSYDSESLEWHEDDQPYIYDLAQQPLIVSHQPMPESLGAPVMRLNQARMLTLLLVVQQQLRRKKLLQDEPNPDFAKNEVQRILRDGSPAEWLALFVDLSAEHPKEYRDQLGQLRPYRAELIKNLIYTLPFYLDGLPPDPAGYSLAHDFMHFVTPFLTQVDPMVPNDESRQMQGFLRNATDIVRRNGSFADFDKSEDLEKRLWNSTLAYPLVVRAFQIFSHHPYNRPAHLGRIMTRDLERVLQPQTKLTQANGQPASHDVLEAQRQILRRALTDPAYEDGLEQLQTYRRRMKCDVLLVR